MHPAQMSCSALLVATLAASPAWAAWPNQPAINLPICQVTGEQNFPVITPDGVGGALIAWTDFRGGATSDIYAQHVLASGVVDPAWPADGRGVCVATNQQQNPVIISDGAGGAIVAWIDLRGTFNYDIYAQHVLASGVVDPAWPLNGRSVCSLTGNQSGVVMVSDGAGGAVLTWNDYRTAGVADIFAHHLLATGVLDPAWPVDGRALCTAVNNQLSPTIASDGAGGALVAWVDARPTASLSLIAAQHVRSSGAVDPVWPPDGRLLSSPRNLVASPVLVGDGAGGAIVTWYDRSLTLTESLTSQHVLVSGVLDPSWPSDGRVISGATVTSTVVPVQVSDGAGGVIIACQDSRNLSLDIYAQHLAVSGVLDPAWPAGGRRLCGASGDQTGQTIASDGANGAIVAWHDYRAGSTNSDIYAAHVLASGATDPAWPVDGRAIGTATNWQSFPVIAADDQGGALIAFNDNRSGVNNDIYAQRVESFGRLGDPQPAIASVKDVPNDNGGHVKLSWNASYLDAPPYNEIASYEVWRSIPPAAAQAALRAGAAIVRAGDLAPLAPGYALKTSLLGASVIYWEFVASQAARRFAGYSMDVSTSGDSIGAGNPVTQFLVEARDADTYSFWNSAAASGYSVDNVPPLTPAPFLGVYLAGAAHLHWLRNSEVDLAGYRLYRGASASFVPGPGNLIAAPADTGYTDLANATFVYKLTAIDAHGNESPVATLTPNGVVDAGEVASLAFAFTAPVPNPASRPTAFRFALPRAGHVRLVIHDLEGRKIRAIADADFVAGAHAITWDLRDGFGRACSAGLYLARLEWEGGTVVRRLAVVR